MIEKYNFDLLLFSDVAILPNSAHGIQIYL